MSDQAHMLRDLMFRRQPVSIETHSEPKGRRACTVAVTSGKGGVGKSNLALNLAIALAQAEQSVCLLDANMGLGNIDLLCGLSGYWNLSHVVTGARTLGEVILEGPAGVHLIPGAGDLRELADCPVPVQKEILNQLAELERAYDLLLIDTGSGIHELARRFIGAADLTLVVTTPEPTAIADAYATIKALSAANIRNLQVLLNQSNSSEQARAVLERIQQTAQLFVHAEVESAGSIPRDECVPAAVASRTPFLIAFPHSPASRSVQTLARRITNLAANRPAAGTFFRKVWEEPVC